MPLPQRRRRWWPLAIVLVVLVLASGFLIHVGYDTIEPGSARPVNDSVRISGARQYAPRGQILFVTVTLRQRVSLYQWLGAAFNPNVDLVNEKDLLGNQTEKQFQQQGVAEMSDSKVLARVLALRHIGVGVPTGQGAEVSTVRPGYPAAAVLRAHDVIVAIDGKPVSLLECAVRDIRAHHPGDRLTLRIQRDGGAPIDVTTSLGADGTNRNVAVLGVSLATKGLRVDAPFQVDIDSGSVVGPSAGVAYALEVLDRLTPGELTGGQSVAVTGELADLQGHVLPIGGVAQKVVAVERAGAKLFLVPRANLAAARAKAGRRLRVEPIDTFDDAIRALATLPGSDAGRYVASKPVC
ncbi:MAG: S16 family serine protease [Acidimicrobiales bacterium]